jgi:hypothetical protein
VRYARVTLAWSEVERGARLAARRYVNGLRLGRTPTHNQPRDRVLWDDLQGIHSEMAHAALRGVPYHPGDDLDSRTGDVAGDHVRATIHESGHLPLYPEDDPTARFVLWVGHGARWELAGWLRAHDGQQPRYRRWPHDGKHPAVRFRAYYVPQADLQPWPPAPDRPPYARHREQRPLLTPDRSRSDKTGDRLRTAGIPESGPAGIPVRTQARGPSRLGF